MIRAWRTLIRVVGVTDDSLEVVIPGWDTQKVVSVPRSQLPGPLRDVEPGRRVHARVNLGAESAEDLVFSGWEPD